MLLDYSGLPSDELRTPPPNGRTPLMSAASENRVRAMDLLLRRRPPPDVNATEDYGRTAMHLAALAGHRVRKDEGTCCQICHLKKAIKISLSQMVRSCFFFPHRKRSNSLFVGAQM